jgi:hypothetical protein
MAKDSKGKRPKKGGPPRSPKKEEVREEVSASRAFIISFIMFSIILAPVLGLGLYFGRTAEAISSVFTSPEGSFLGGMLIGVSLAFIISLVFTRKAVATA